MTLLILLLGCHPYADASTNRYALIGKHRDATCEDCHGDALGPLPTSCASCHEEDRPQGHYPGQDCGGCHTPEGWGAIDHSFFPLTQAHDLECAACHEGGSFSGLDPACESCHEQDRPKGHFPGPCEDCHVPTRWSDASFDHGSFFPVPHRGVSACEDCHLDPGDYSSFSCIDCHTHSKSVTDGQHQGEVSNYSYKSSACLKCHPRGIAEDR